MALGFVHAYERGESDDTLLVLHATGGDEHQLMPLARQLAPTANLLAPRGEVMEGGVTRRFFARRGMFDLDIPGLMAVADDLARFVVNAAAEYGFDPTRVRALGYSNGANVAVGMLFRHPEVLAGAALLRPTLPYEPEDVVPMPGRGVLIAAASDDPYVPDGATDRLAQILTAAGADVTMSVLDTGHGLLEEDLEVTARWLASGRLTP